MLENASESVFLASQRIAARFRYRFWRRVNIPVSIQAVNVSSCTDFGGQLSLGIFVCFVFMNCR